jgi:hypothetical protein
MQLYANLCSEREVEVNARAELDEAQMLIDIAVFARRGIGDDAASHSACHLPSQYLRAVGRFDDNQAVLVLIACLRKPCLVEIAVMMLYGLYLTVDGKPVGMHIKRAHEDGNHQSAVMEILSLFYLLNDHHTAVGGSHDYLLRVFIEITNGTTVKIHDNHVKHTKNGKKALERHLRVKQMPKKIGDGSDNQTANDQCAVAFAMKSLFLEFPYSSSHDNVMQKHVSPQ